MQFPNLHNGRFSETLENGGSPGSNRRNFLKTLGIVGVGVALAPTGVLANPVKSFLNPSANAAWLASCYDWLSCVKSFVSVVSAGNPALARQIIYLLENSEIEEAPRYSGFHYRYAPRHAFTRKIDLQKVICDNGFMVDLFPYYGVDCTCESDYDLNAPEMNRVTAKSETDFYKCVVAPAGSRLETDFKDHAEYRELLANTYTKHKPEDWSLKYKRRMVSLSNGKHYRAFGIENTTQTDSFGKRVGDVLITPYEV